MSGGDPTPESPVAGRRVLVVEDQEAQRWLFAAALRGEGFDVIEASEGDEALQKCQGVDHLDLVVTDLWMPIMGGLELVERLTSVFATFKVLFVSAYLPEELSLPATSVMQKPFTREMLVARVHAVLDNAELVH